MAKNNTIPVRLDDKQLAAVQHYSARFGVTDAQFLRWAIDALLRYVDLHQGNLPLPIDFSVHWKTALQLAEEAIREGKSPPISDRLNKDPAPYNPSKAREA
jgi:hypothetical protein